MRRLLVCIVAFVATGCAAPAAEPVGQEPTVTPQVEAPRKSLEPVSRPKPVAPADFHLWEFDAPVVPLSLTGSSLVPPDDPSVVGWWGRKAGAKHGTTLLTGHTVSTGGGELDDLEHTPVGTQAVVSGIRYRVDSVRVISKARLAEEAPRLFSQSGPHRLVVVTCEGYDPATGHYRDNVVVVASPFSGPRSP